MRGIWSFKRDVPQRKKDEELNIDFCWEKEEIVNEWIGSNNILRLLY